MGGGCCIGNCCVLDLPSCCVGFFQSLFCDDSCCVGNSSAPSESEKFAKKVAEELAEMKQRVEQSSSKQEQKMLDNITNSLKSFLKELDNLNQRSYGGESLSIDVETINRKNKELEKQVVGCISNVLNRRLVQTDKELSIILAERDDKKRTKNFEQFVQRVQKEAIDTFKSTIEKTVKAQSKVVSDEIHIRKKEINNRMKESVRELDEIMKVKEKSNAELEKKQIGYMYQSSLCELLLLETQEG